jgi:hypothetical protein
MSYSTTAGSDLRRRWIDWGGPILVAIAIGAVVYLALSALEPNAKEHKVCDALVQTLLTTRDAVELQRAGIFVRELDCDVSHRAGPVLYRQLVPQSG